MEFLRSNLPGVRFRRARLCDAVVLRQWMNSWHPGAEGIPLYDALNDGSGSDSDVFADLIQSSYLCITALSSTEESSMVGFLALGTHPRPSVMTESESVQKTTVSFDPLADQKALAASLGVPGWENLLRTLGYLPPDQNPDPSRLLPFVYPYNTLWLNMLIAPSSTDLSKYFSYEDFDKDRVPRFTYPDQSSRQPSTTFQSRAKPKIKDECSLLKHSYSSIELTEELLCVALSAMQEIEHILCAHPSFCLPLQGEYGDFLSNLCSLGVLLSPTRRNVSALDGANVTPDLFPAFFRKRQKILLLSRKQFLPRLTIRHGRQEDYDDFVPLLLNGVGVRMRLPEQFYLEELLKEQSETHKVLVAENPLTYEVVGFACVHLISLTEHHALAKTYQMMSYDKVREKKSTYSFNAKGPAAETKKIVKIDFLYWNPDYEGSSWDLLYGLFHAFPTCSDTFIELPHNTRESSLLKKFHYIPIRPYEPYVSRDDIAPMPEGLWICSRESLSQARVNVVGTTEQVSEVENQLLRPQSYDIAYSEMDKICADLRSSAGGKPCNEEDLQASSLVPTSCCQREGADYGSITAFTLSRISSEYQGENSTELVGVASLCPVTVRGLHAFRANYNIDNYVYFYTRRGRDFAATDIHTSPRAQLLNFCTEKMNSNNIRDLAISVVLIRNMYVKPIFRGYIRFFVREILRQCRADMMVLFPIREQGQAFFPLVRELLPCQPRRVVEPSMLKDATAGEATGTVPTVMDTAPLASLFIATPRYLGDEKLTLHTRLVVIGASATALCFFHRLLSIPYVRFTNLVLITTDGFPVHPNQAHANPEGVHTNGLGNEHKSAWLTDTMELLEREHYFLSVSQAIRVVCGRLVDIDKTNKYVTVDNSVFEPYDYLVLATGRQYVVPMGIHQLLQQEGRGVPEKSIIPLSDDSAFHRARESLDNLTKNASGVPNVIVYGSSLDAYSVVTAILRREGFSPQRVVVCSRDVHTPHMDQASSQAALTVLRSLGINVFRGFDLGRMEFNEDGGLTSVVLEPVPAAHSSSSSAAITNASLDDANHVTASSVELNCGLILCVEDKDIDSRIISALNKRSIVLDGRIVVDKDYRTTDPYILAAGPVAMWTRRYGVTPNFEDFNARDVGYDLAGKLLTKLGFNEFSDPFPSNCNEENDATSSYGNLSTNHFDKTLPNFQNDSTRHGRQVRSFSRRDSEHTNTPPHGVATSVDHAKTGLSDWIPQQVRKGPDISLFSASRARRVMFPFGFQYFSVECVFFTESACEMLTCSNICSLSEMRDRLLKDLDNSTTQRSDGEKGTQPHSPQPFEHSLTGGKSTVETSVSSSQSVLSIYVNRATHNIDAVRYFGDGSPELYNYMAIIGYPELLLNLTFRYKEAVERSRQTGKANLPPTCSLTANVLNHQLDLVNYLRLPYFKIIFSDRFVSFFETLRLRMRQHEEFVRTEEQILAKRMTKKTFEPLTKEEANTHVKMLSDSRRAFRQEVELALVRFLHENKEFAPNLTFLPSIKHLVDKNEPILSMM